MKMTLVVLLASGLILVPASSARPGSRPGADDKNKKEEKKKDKKEKKSSEEAEGPAESKDLNREMTRIVRELQFAMEGGSARALLSLIDPAKFDDYPRFEDMVERLMREDTLRAHFRQVTSSAQAAEGRGQSILDAEMGLSRKDASGQVLRRRQQLTLDFERTRRGWRITNITPRNYFEPL